MLKSVQLIFAGLLVILLVSEVKAEEASDTLWSFEGSTHIHFSDVSLTQWAGGGVNTTSINGMLNASATREGLLYTWETRLRSGYGNSRLGDRSNPFRKTDDFLFLYSGFSRGIAPQFDAIAMFDFRTQFRPGYRYDADDERTKVSDFLAPAFLVTSIGVEYEPVENLKFNLSPISGKTTFILHDDIKPIADLYGLEPGESIKHEFGMSFSTFFKFRIMENIHFENELLLFSPYLNFGNIDVNWETMLSLKVNDYISAAITTHLIYDEDILVEREDGTVGPGTQFKRAISVGLTYDFF